jgi:hypothetical protein
MSRFFCPCLQQSKSKGRGKWYNEVLLFNISLRYNRYSHSAQGSRTLFNRFSYSVGGLFYSTSSSFTKLGAIAPLSRRYFSSTSFLFSNSTLGSSDVVPVKIYRNADLHKLEILKENLGKAGVYR